jgi:AraC-like DNA-binding protein
MGVSIVMVRAVLATVERQGVQPDAVLEAASIDAARLDDLTAQLTLAEYDRFRQAAIALSGDEALGLHLVEHARSAAFDVVGHLTEHAATLRQGIETLAKYSRLVTAGPPPELSEEGASACIRFAFRHDASARTRFAAELTLSGFMLMIQGFVGREVRPRGVYFAYPAPPHRAEYTRIFAGSERFEHAFTGIEFDRAWLDRTQPYKSEELYAVLQQQAERALSRIERDAPLAQRVIEHLTAHDPRALPSMDGVARSLGMSARSLRRRLLSEGAVYKQLVEQVVMTRAKRMLEDPRISIQEAAYATGFATPAAFHRAFKRWTGLTPKAYKASF